MTTMPHPTYITTGTRSYCITQARSRLSRSPSDKHELNFITALLHLEPAQYNVRLSERRESTSLDDLHVDIMPIRPPPVTQTSSMAPIIQYHCGSVLALGGRILQHECASPLLFPVPNSACYGLSVSCFPCSRGNSSPLFIHDLSPDRL